MSSVSKPLATSTSPVTTSSRPGSNSRLVSSSFGSVSELYAQSGINGEGEQPGFDEFGSGDGRHENGRQQPKTLKLLGTSRTFAMLFEESTDDFFSTNNDGNGPFGGSKTSGKPAFQAYMFNATSTYDLSTRAIAGETRNRGGSLNIAL